MYIVGDEIENHCHVATWNGLGMTQGKMWMEKVYHRTKIYRILHGKCARTVFTHELWGIRNQTSERSERVRFLIQKKEGVNTVQSTFHVVLCLLYTYWDWTPSLNYDKLYLNKCVKQQSLKESSFVKSERAQIKSKTYEIKLAYLSSRLFSWCLTPQFEFFSTSFLFLFCPDRNFLY